MLPASLSDATLAARARTGDGDAFAELIYCWDPDGPLDPRGFARADHCVHLHWGMDA